MNGVEVTPFVHLSHDHVGPQIFVETINGKEDIVEYIHTLLQRESVIHPPCIDYLSKIRSAKKADGDLVNEKWRRKLCEWCYEVTDHFKCKYFYISNM
jgi:hypothetical protein